MKYNFSSSLYEGISFLSTHGDNDSPSSDSASSPPQQQQPQQQPQQNQQNEQGKNEIISIGNGLLITMAWGISYGIGQCLSHALYSEFQKKQQQQQRSKKKREKEEGAGKSDSESMSATTSSLFLLPSIFSCQSMVSKTYDTIRNALTTQKGATTFAAAFALWTLRPPNWSLRDGLWMLGAAALLLPNSASTASSPSSYKTTTTDTDTERNTETKARGDKNRYKNRTRSIGATDTAASDVAVGYLSDSSDNASSLQDESASDHHHQQLKKGARGSKQQQHQPQKTTLTTPLPHLTRGDRTGSVDDVIVHFPSSLPSTSNNTRFLELLVHNVSHTDLVLSLGLPPDAVDDSLHQTPKITNGSSRPPFRPSSASPPPPPPPPHGASNVDAKIMENKQTSPRERGETEQPPTATTKDGRYMSNDSDTSTMLDVNQFALCRPRFSTFDMYSRRVLQSIQPHVCEGANVAWDDHLRKRALISFPLYDRSEETPRFALVSPKPGRRRDVLPVGFDLDAVSDLSGLPKHSSRISNGNPVQKHRSAISSTISSPTLLLSTSVLSVPPEELLNLRLRGRDVGRFVSMCGQVTKDYHSIMEYCRRSNGDEHATLGTVSSPPFVTPTPLTAEQKTPTFENGFAKGNSKDPVVTPRQENRPRVESSDAVPPARLNAVFFPLLATLMRRWHAQMADKYGSTPTSPMNSTSNTNISKGRNGHENGSNSVSTKRVKKVLILVTGVGTPRNWTHSIDGNSTQACAKLMETYIRLLYPDVTVVLIHSQTNIFRYDENIAFVKRELMPCIDAYRDAHARGEPYPDEPSYGLDDSIMSFSPSPVNAKRSSSIGAHTSQNRRHFDVDWKKTLSVTLSFADGSPARTHAIQASLRSYRPTYFHFWQLKTFWHDTKISDEDIEVHSFEDMENVPAMESTKVSERARMVVEEMKTFRQYFLETIAEGRGDIHQFWLRKTKKPVLAVLLVESPGKDPVLYRGTNMEVSMPTGSLCAERNVIGTAFAADPSLKREDLRMVAVLAVPMPTIFSPPLGTEGMMICRSVGSSTEGGIGNGILTGEKLVRAVEEKLTSQENIRERSMSVGSFASIVEVEKPEEYHDEMEWTIENSATGISSALPCIEGDANMVTKTVSGVSSANATSPNSPPIPTGDTSSKRWTPPGTPLRRIKLMSNSDVDIDEEGIGGKKPTGKPTMGVRRGKRTVIVHSPQDINPLMPCGACNEWLKKIAECNPYFKVITFTDADCNGVYVNPMDMS